MEDFKYVDLFSTKGIEYILVLFFLGVFILFWRMLNKSHPENSVSDNLVTVKMTLVDWFYIVKEYFYHHGHTWADATKEDVVRIGIDDFAQKMLGKFSHISLPKVGTNLIQGGNGIKLTVDNIIFGILSPVDGKVIEINKEVIMNPELVNKDPFNHGWLLKVRPTNLKPNLNNMINSDCVETWMHCNVNQVSNMMSKDYGIVLQDGGLPVSGFMREIDPQNWHEYARKFLRTNVD